MTNNKQSSVEWLAVRLKEKMQVWNSTKNYQEFHIVLEAGEFAKLIEQAKEKHGNEVRDAFYIGRYEYNNFDSNSTQYYNETFGGNND